MFVKTYYRMYNLIMGIWRAQMEINSIPFILKSIRSQRRLKQTDIAELLQTTQQQIAKYESTNPKYFQEIPVRHIITLARYYGVSTDYLLGLTNDPAPHYE